MQSVKIDKTSLLAKVKENRDLHHTTYLKAYEGYRTKVVQELEDMLSDAKEGKKIRKSVNLPEPSDHTAEYDQIISMLEYSVDAIIELSAVEFDQYVLDNWHWKQMETLTNMHYLSDK